MELIGKITRPTRASRDETREVPVTEIMVMVHSVSQHIKLVKITKPNRTTICDTGICLDLLILFEL